MAWAAPAVVRGLRPLLSARPQYFKGKGSGENHSTLSVVLTASLDSSHDQIRCGVDLPGNWHVWWQQELVLLFSAAVGLPTQEWYLSLPKMCALEERMMAQVPPTHRGFKSQCHPGASMDGVASVWEVPSGAPLATSNQDRVMDVPFPFLILSSEVPT